MEPAAEVPALASAAPRVSGFWRRVAAYAVDGLVLGAAGQALGFAFYDRLCGLAWGGRLLGLAVALSYLVPLTSAWGGGQTLGQRLLKIRVVDVSGRPVSVGRAALREFVLCFPFFLNGVLLPVQFNTPVAATAVIVVVFLIGPSVIYLAAFNGRTRQGLHDLLAGTFVVPADQLGGLESLPPIWGGHYAVIGVFSAALVAGGWWMMRWVSGLQGMPEILEASRRIQDTGRWTVVSLVDGRQSDYGSKDGARKSTFMTLAVLAEQPIRNPEKDADDMVRILFAADPQALQADRIAVSERRGFDLGIASFWTNKGAAYSTAEWRARLSSGTAAAPPSPPAP
jgi:uncharacterized RDD family membrane protein YckC